MDYLDQAIGTLQQRTAAEGRNKLWLEYRDGFWIDYFGPQWEERKHWSIQTKGFGSLGYLEVAVKKGIDENGEQPVLLLSNIHGTIKSACGSRDDFRYREFTERYHRNPFDLAVEYLLRRAKSLVRQG